jgi:glutathionyl-hydroquinone reductase
MRTLKGLEQIIPVSVVHPLMLENGWTFGTDFPEATGDDLYHLRFPLTSSTCARRPALHRACHCTGPVGQAAADHRQQRIRRYHPHVQQRIRWRWRTRRRLLSCRTLRPGKLMS